MRKYIMISLFCLLGIAEGKTENRIETIQAEQDTVQSHFLNEVIVSASSKETNPLQSLPASVSFFTPQMISGQGIATVKDLSMLVPNFFVADYGSRLSTPVYIRGIGERTTGQSIGMYVDNMPLLDKSVFDIDLVDVRQIDVLRGPQGTLYGRNAMSGIVNVTTFSPIDVQQTTIQLSGGNYGLLGIKAGTSQLLTDNVGVSVNGYYSGYDGYFRNQYSGKRIDDRRTGGGRVRLDWRINPAWTVQLMANYDYTDQGAYPYGEYADGEITRPNYNYPGSYIRETVGTNLNIRYKNEHIILNSSTAFLHFNDEMNMDIDYGPADIFSINQQQKQNAFTEELTVRSNSTNDYQWSAGVFGFHNNLTTDVVTTMGRTGIEEYIEAQIGGNIPPMAPVSITVANNRIPMPGQFETPSYGFAIFHQSTYNNLLAEGLSVTAGIRLDYEKAKLDYNTRAAMEMQLVTPAPIPISIPADTLIKGSRSTSFTEILPKIALKYEFDNRNYIYATVSNGYKTGGYNIQNFADISRNALMAKAIDEVRPYTPAMVSLPEINPMSIDSLVPYSPEYSWNYEVGFKGELIKELLMVELALFYIDVRDMQITDFVESGQGRIVKNAGKAHSWGFDLGLSARLTTDLRLTANYGLARAKFRDYKTSLADYGGNYIPFAPQNTLALGAIYTKQVRSKLIDRFHVQAHYNGAGRIYWTEENDVYQDFYGLLNLKAGVSKGIFDLNIWANNVLDTNYTAFYFETERYKLGQAGRPVTFGADLKITF